MRLYFVKINAENSEAINNMTSICYIRYVADDVISNVKLH